MALLVGLVHVLATGAIHLQLRHSRDVGETEGQEILAFAEDAGTGSEETFLVSGELGND